MYNGLLHAHSGLRWIVLLLLVLTVILSLIKWRSKTDALASSDANIFKFNTIFIHVQLLLGIVLLAMKEGLFVEGWIGITLNRFYALEHPLMMIIAAVLVTIGGAKMKRKTNGPSKYKTIFIFNVIALLIILAMIPWPFRNLGAGLF